MRLDRFANGDFERGRPWWTEALWLIVQALLVESWLPGSAHRIKLLRLFGAQIGQGVAIKPHVRIKFPWRLEVGDYSWLGEGVWIDNLATVTIGSHCCLSQGVYLCTGNHNWSAETFDLITHPIVLEDQVWLCARSSVGPGVRAGQGAVLTLGSVAQTELSAWRIHSGNPAVAINDRRTK
ncbi:MAG: colanic acid biosynthesis acetyltransferase WcaF [Candidatus Binataceae bacterium]|nr:colanic acid biosynthesis acetyltransferase WcaF [Candidatus Binataceae bacterium]